MIFVGTIFIGLFGLGDLSSTSQVRDRDDPPLFSPLPDSTHGHSAQLLGNRLYVFGGYGPNSISLDLETGKWSESPAMNVRKVFFGSVIVDEKIYSIGAKSDKEKQSVIERFDPTVNEWKVVARSSKLPPTHFSTTSIGEKIYVVGGISSDQAGVLVFDSRSGKISEMQSIPGSKPGDHFHYVVNLKGKLHVLGGMRFAEENGPLKRHWMWNGMSWIEKAPLPEPSLTKFAAYGVLNDKLYVFSKHDGLHHLYDPTTNRWTDSPAEIPINRVMAACVTKDNHLHVIGGKSLADKSEGRNVCTYDAHHNEWRIQE